MLELQDQAAVENPETVQSKLENKNQVAYTYDKVAKATYNDKEENFNEWVKKNASRAGEAILNDSNIKIFKADLMKYLVYSVTDDGENSNSVLQLSYVARYGSGEYRALAEEALKIYEKASGKEIPQVIDPVQESRLAADRANTEIIKKAALTDYEVLNRMAVGILLNPLESIPRDWYKVAGEIQNEIEQGEVNKVVDRLLINIKNSELDAVKLTIELLQKYASNDIKNEKAPDAGKHASDILTVIKERLSNDVAMAKRNFEEGDMEALAGVVGYEQVNTLVHRTFIGSFSDSFSTTETQKKAEAMQVGLREREGIQKISIKDSSNQIKIEKPVDAISNPMNAYSDEYKDIFNETFNVEDKFKLDENHIGYYISEISLEDAAINLESEVYRSNPNNVDKALMNASREKAIYEFQKRGMGMTRQEISTYLTEINADNTVDSNKKIAFWRMPMPGSEELKLKRIGEWKDL